MGLNGVNSYYTGYEAVSGKKTAAKDIDNTTASKNTDVAATYEASNVSDKASASSVKSKAANPELIAKLKADSDNRLQQLQSLVTNMFKKQGITIGTADDMWKVLASGNFTADADTIAKAKEDISEDGYWGVKQTSDRIFDFAQALAGDDEEKMKAMKEAVEKGFKEATKTWGKELPDISKNTYNAVMDKFDKYFSSKKTDSTQA
jgi:anti-sigma28 factor (negative regulator of flagellin synthesis)